MTRVTFGKRLLLVAFLPALLVASMMSLYFIVNSLRYSEQAEIQRALTLAQGLSRAAEFGVATNNSGILKEAANPILDVPSISAVRYFGSSGEGVFQVNDSSHVEGEISNLGLRIRNVISDHPLKSTVTSVIQRTDLTLYEDPLFVSDQSNIGKNIDEIIGRIELDVDLSLVYQNQYQAIRKVLIFVALVLAIALTAAYRLAQSVIVPVKSLTQTVQHLAKNEYVKAKPVAIGGELDELAKGINHLSGELQSFHAKQAESIRQATAGLQETLLLLENKNRELELARESAEKASDFKSQFVANMSHEIRTPLNAIIGTLSVMNKSGLDITQVDQFDMIKNSSNTLLYLVEDILDISKIESGNLVVESIRTNLDDLLSEVFETMAMQALDRGIELYVSPIPDLNLRDTYTDPIRLKQVLLNLLSNAIKFTHSGHVALYLDILGSQPTQRTIRFTVEDTGIGIPENKKDSLFSAFTQVDMSITRQYGGTGLGLFISRGIVELLGGTIQLISEERKGTRIEVVLPMVVSKAAQSQPVCLAEADDVIRYEDEYKPLEAQHRGLLNTAFSAALEASSGKQYDDIIVKHIPNAELSSSWLTHHDKHIAPSAIHRNGRQSTRILAWISQITPPVKKQLEKAGYSGYVLKTPSLIQLTRNVQMAVSDRCFSNLLVKDTIDERPSYSSNTLTVLAVDDQGLNIDLLMQFFDYLNVRGIYAVSGREALSYIESERVDLVLLDLHMPEIDGYEVAAKIRSGNSINAQVPIIAMTADAYQSTREKALACGFDAVLTKPATVHQINDTINHWVSSYAQKKSEDTSPIVDVKACAESVRGDEQWARGALKTYGEEIPDHIENIRRALRARDQSALFQAAHALKGVSQLFQIHEVANAVERVEKACNGRPTLTNDQAVNTIDWLDIEQLVEDLEVWLRKAESECKSLPA